MTVSLKNAIKANNLLKTVFDATPLGMILIDADRRVHAINEFMRRTFGIKEAEVTDLNLGKILKCLNETEAPGSCMNSGKCTNCILMNAASRTIKTGQVYRDQFDVTLKVGEQKENRLLKITSAPVELNDERYALLILEDLTELNYLRSQLKNITTAPRFLGQDPKVNQLREKIHILADVDIPVMIQGESGTGKELIARAIHNEGPRKDMPFVAVNCGAIPETLLESELFGHVKGAFTGAIRDKKGRFEMADGGTIFLDEIGDISPAMQVKLLRVLQEGAFERVGGEETLHVDVRIISATNKDIKAEIKAGRFREDLFYRLCVVPLFIPPLRERPGDIPLIAEAILRESAAQFQRPVENISSDAMNALVHYPWPGNVRELQNAIQYALVHCRSNTLNLQDLPPHISHMTLPPNSKERKSTKRKKLSKTDVEYALQQSGGNKVEAAKILGVGRATLYRFLGSMKN